MCLSACLTVSSSVCPSVHLKTYLPISCHYSFHPACYPSIQFPIYLSNYPPVCTSILPFVYHSIYLFNYLVLCLSVYFSIHQSLWRCRPIQPKASHIHFFIFRQRFIGLQTKDRPVFRYLSLLQKTKWQNNADILPGSEWKPNLRSECFSGIRQDMSSGRWYQQSEKLVNITPLRHEQIHVFCASFHVYCSFPTQSRQKFGHRTFM
jgi:hypothetical protein